MLSLYPPATFRAFPPYFALLRFIAGLTLVAWTRITYPDNSTLDLGGMSGADQAGYAGFKDKVNNRCG